MIRRGSLSGKVYRAVHSRDAHGDPIDADGNVTYDAPYVVVTAVRR